MTPKSASLFLAIVLMSGIATAAETAKSSAAAPNLSPSLTGSAPLQTYESKPPDANAESSLTPSDNICYKIHAFLFKRDDDHAPQYIGSTTCGPRQPHEKNADWPKPKLVPAN